MVAGATPNFLLPGRLAANISRELGLNTYVIDRAVFACIDVEIPPKTMKKQLVYRGSFAALLLGLFTVRLAADVVETKNGARIVGTVTKIEGGNVFVKTTYAGDLTIKQGEVAGITTDAPVSVRLGSGTILQGRVASDRGAVKIVGADGDLTTNVDKIAASWGAGGEDPAVTAMKKDIAARERKWVYETTVDVTGKTGNKSQLGTAAGVKATLAGAQDKLVFYTAYDRQITDGRKSADQFKAGLDYSNNFSGSRSWYVRDEGGFDRVKDIQLYNIAAFGLGYDVIKQPKQILTFRAGLSYRYEGYKNPLTTDVNSAGMDFGFAHELTLADSKLVNSLTVVPSFNDFNNYRATHASYFELPLANPAWKLRVGVANDYNSKPGRGVEKMDTSYFTRLVLNWR